MRATPVLGDDMRARWRIVTISPRVYLHTASVRLPRTATNCAVLDEGRTKDLADTYLKD